MAASMPLPSASTSKLPLYFRSLLTVAILLWPGPSGALRPVEGESGSLAGQLATFPVQLKN